MRCSRCANDLRRWCYIVTVLMLTGHESTVNLCHVCMAHLVGHASRQRIDDFCHEKGWALISPPVDNCTVPGNLSRADLGHEPPTLRGQKRSPHLP